MKFFLDTANIDEIREAKNWGILDGVTTNPSLVAKERKAFIPLIEEICDLVPEGDISAEVTATDFDGIVKEAHELAKLRKNIVVKVPLIKEGIKAVKVLSSEGIRINTTLCFSAVQALLAAKVGASYISPFVGRLDEAASDGMRLVRNIREIYDKSQYKTEILVAALRHPMHVLDAALAGAEVVTMPFGLLDKLFQHPMTDIGLKAFLKDWASVKRTE